MKKNLRKLQQKVRKLMLLAVLGLLACWPAASRRLPSPTAG